MQHRRADGKLHAITLHPELEQQFASSLQALDEGTAIVTDPSTMQRAIAGIATQMERAAARGQEPVLLTSARIRRPLRKLIERSLPTLPVLAYCEISSEVEVEAVGMVEAGVTAGASALTEPAPLEGARRAS